jgi:hypothetical protein
MLLSSSHTSAIRKVKMSKYKKVALLLAFFMVSAMNSSLAFCPVGLRYAVTAEVSIHGKSSRLLTTVTWATEEGDDDDDGWGTSSDFEEKTKELRALQISAPRSKSSVQRSDEPSEERDLFIPIFAVVSLLGLFGSYGYEMARLASRGELYLPWNN